MTTVRLKYVHGFRDRHGKVHYYFRYRGERWRLPAPGTEGFATAYDGLLAPADLAMSLISALWEFGIVVEVLAISLRIFRAHGAVANRGLWRFT